MAPPPPAGALPPTAGGLKLSELELNHTQITDAGCAVLAAALDSGALPALEDLNLNDIPASTAAKEAAQAALARSVEKLEMAEAKVVATEVGLKVGQAVMVVAVWVMVMVVVRVVGPYNSFSDQMF